MNKDNLRALGTELQLVGNYMLERAKDFDGFDWAIFKVCLVSLGLLVGAKLAGIVRRIRGFLVIVFFLSWIYTMWRIFFSD